MKLIIEPTNEIKRVDGARVRVWKGETTEGIPVLVYINCVTPQTHDVEALAIFERTLELLPPGRIEPSGFDIRFVS